MNPSAQRNVVRAAGGLLGVCLAAALLLAFRPGANAAPFPASVRVAVAPTGELEVTPPPPRPVLAGAALRPGGPRARGGFLVRNQTGGELAVALKAEADSTTLDGLLRVRVQSGGHTLAETTLEGLELRPLRLRLASGQRARLGFEAWLPRDVLSGYEGSEVGVSLTPQLRRVGGPG